MRFTARATASASSSKVKSTSGAGFAKEIPNSTTSHEIARSSCGIASRVRVTSLNSACSFGPFTVFLARKRAAEDWLYAEYVEIVSGDGFDPCGIGVFSVADRGGSLLVERQSRDASEVVLKVPAIGIRNTRSLDAAGTDGFENCKLPVIRGAAEGVQDHSVDPAKDSRGGGDTERQRQHRSGGESRRLAKCARRVLHVPARIVEPGERTSVAMAVLHLFDAAERTLRRDARVLAVHAAALKFGFEQREMSRRLARQFVFRASGPKDVDQPQQRAPHPGRQGVRHVTRRHRQPSSNRSLSTRPASRRQRAICLSSDLSPALVIA